MWQEIEEKFNAQASCKREGCLQKKWDNIKTKHRAIYSDYKREMATTGGGPGGPAEKRMFIITHAVMDLIGRETVSIQGVVAATMDTTSNQLRNSMEKDENTIPQVSAEQDIHTNEPGTPKYWAKSYSSTKTLSMYLQPPLPNDLQPKKEET